MTKVIDSINVDGVRIRDDGSLVVDARVARTGIYEYKGSEVGRPDMDIVRVYRSSDEVFAETAMASFTHKPVTNDHPPQNVTSKNWRKYAVGYTDSEIRQDGRFLRIPMMISDADAVEQVRSGKIQLSNGYDCVFDFTPGVTPEGETYDALQRDIRGNHVAIVDAGRAGSECRIGDGAVQQWGVTSIQTLDLKGKSAMSETEQKVVDGIPVSCSRTTAAVIDKLVDTRDSLQESLDAAVKAAADAKSAHDAEMAAKDAAIDAAKASIVDAATIDAMVAERSTLLDNARKIDPNVVTDGVSNADVRKAVVVAKVGDSVLQHRTGAALDAYIDARFDTLVEAVADTKPVDQFAQTIATSDGVANQSPDALRQAAFDQLMSFDTTGHDMKGN